MDKKRLLCSGLALIASLCFLVPLFADEGQESASGKRAPLIAPSGERIASSVPGGTLRFSRRETFSPNGSYLIFVAQGDRWITAGEVLSDKYFRKMTIDLAGWVDSDEARIRIEQRGGGAAHLDCIALNGTAASNLEGFLARKLSKADYDVIDSYGKTFEIVFKGVPRLGKAPLVLELTGRVESETISKVPFQFPLDNMHTEMSAESAFYSYRPGSHPGTLTLDGELAPEALGEPFFKEFYPTGSGHPDAPVYGWVFDDGETLYVAIDFLGDNTMDGNKDYTKVYVNTSEGLKEFEVTAEHMEWGRPGFTYTARTGWQHKVYEFAIPLSEIGADQEIRTNANIDHPLQIAFAAYGTACPTGGVLEFGTDPNGVEPDSGASGTAFAFTANFTQGCNSGAPTVAQVWIDLDKDGIMDAAKTPLVLLPPGSTPPLIFLVSLAGFVLLVWTVRRRHGLTRLRILFAVIVAAATLSAAQCPSEPGDEEETYTTQELYDMVYTDPVPDWIAGVDFSAMAVIKAPPGVYTFKFYFKDSGSVETTLGGAAGDLSLTIN